MKGFTTPFKDNCGYDHVPTSGAGSSSSEPNMPSGTPGRSGGMLPEKIRDTAVTPKTPGWVSPDNTDLKW